MNKLILCSTIFMCMALAVEAQQTFTLKGKLAEVKESQKIILKYSRGIETIRDTATINNGSFTFAGQLQYPVRAELYLIHKQEGRPDIQDFFAEQGKITVEGRKSLKTALIQGGKTQREYLRLRKELKPLQDLHDETQLKWSQLLYQKLAAAKKKFGPELTTDQFKEAAAAASLEMPPGLSLTELRAKIAKLEHGFVRQHPDSYVSFDLVRRYVKTDIDAVNFESLYNSLSQRLLDTEEARLWPIRFLRYRVDAFNLEKLKATYAHLESKYKNTSLAAEAGEISNKILQRINALETTATGSPAIPIVKNDLNGKPVNWESFKGKYVLLDFWASWCKPCRASHPHLKELYTKYKDKGFEILGIAYERGDRLDLIEKTWKAAIRKDGLPWTQVLNDIDKDKFDAFKAYGVVGGGLKILLDNEGKIVGRYDGSETELDQKLKDVFGF